jgi:peroxiredoxin
MTAQPPSAPLNHPRQGSQTMALMHTPICEFGWKAKDFSAAGTDGKTYSLRNIRGPNGTLVVFICNHCPYVRAIADRLVDEIKALQDIGINAIAIMSNDTSLSPGDSFEDMKRFADEHVFNFPYVIDESQDIARAYDAVCTPDFFGFNADDKLQYRGRLDASKMQLVGGAKRELYKAMKQIAETGHGPKDQIASMGCSIKWREAA